MSSTLNLILQKKVTLSACLEKVNSWKKQGLKIVFTNGCFDLLHRGHIEYLAQSADLGDKLIVGLNDDQSIKSLNKGANRPIQNENDRALILSAIGFIDLIVLFSESTPLNLIKAICPDILVKGGDYDINIQDKKNKKYIVGSDFVKSYSGEVVTIPLTEGYSTSNIEKKIKGM